MNEIHFRMAEIKDKDKLAKLLLSQDFGYPVYEPWVDKAISEFEMGWKDVMLGFYDDLLVADLISQPHKIFPSILYEIKNGRVLEGFQRGYFLNLMLRQREIAARKQNFAAVILDIRADNFPVLNLTEKAGYYELLRTCLYENKEDVVKIKPLKSLENEFFVPIKNKIITNSF